MSPEPGSNPANVDVVGVTLSADMALPTVERSHVVVVVDGWGTNWGERLAATRAVAGALALRNKVTIVSLEDRSVPGCNPPLRYDGVFPVHSVAAAPAIRLDSRDDALGRALARVQGIGRGHLDSETAADARYARLARPSPGAIDAIDRLQPDVVVLAGLATFWLGVALPVDSRPAVVALPLCGEDPALSAAGFRQVANLADVMTAVSPLEMEAIRRATRSTDGAINGGGGALLRLLDIAFPVNALAATASMAGLAGFGRYLLVISHFDEDPATGRCPPHDLWRHFLGDVAVAEVKRATWVVTGDGRRFDIPWPPSRVNLWRLMSRAELTVDLRPAGPLGREAMESLRFGTPVVVPERSVAAAKVAEANGGLWYSSPSEMFDCAEYLLCNDGVRSHLGESGRQWADTTHGDVDGFVEQVGRLTLLAQQSSHQEYLTRK